MRGMQADLSASRSGLAESLRRGCYLSSDRRRPRLLRRPPFQTFQQHRHLCRCQRNRTFLGVGPGEAALLQSLREQAEALTVPVQHLDEMTSAPTEAKNGTREWVLLQHLLRLH